LCSFYHRLVFSPSHGVYGWPFFPVLLGFVQTFSPGVTLFLCHWTFSGDPQDSTSGCVFFFFLFLVNPPSFSLVGRGPSRTRLQLFYSSLVPFFGEDTPTDVFLSARLQLLDCIFFFFGGAVRTPLQCYLSGNVVFFSDWAVPAQLFFFCSVRLPESGNCGRDPRVPLPLGFFLLEILVIRVGGFFSFFVFFFSSL